MWANGVDGYRNEMPVIIDLEIYFSKIIWGQKRTKKLIVTSLSTPLS
jgi:hypothetical protein